MIDTQTLQVFFSSLSQILQWPTFGFMLLGMLIGFWVGILPGLGGSTTLALMLPFVFTMDPLTAFAFLLGMHAVVATTGDITSILFGVPGEATTVATVFDGYPLTKQGQAGRALGISFASSLIGALVGAFALAISIPFVRPIVLSFGPPEFFMLAVLGLSFIVGLSGRSLSKGLLMAGFGLLLSTVGEDVATGRLRFIFGQVYLSDGVPLVPVAVGLFAIPSILEMMALKTSIARVGIGEVSGAVEGAKDTVRHWWLTVRSSLIGVFIGIIPGMGGGTSQFIAYAHAQQTSKHKELFGKGSIEGLIAATAVNNSKEGASILPTVAFGIPGGPAMAILLGAFLITGINPGPSMLTTNLHVTFGMVWTIVLANIITVAICFLFIKRLAWLTFIKGSLMVPFLIFLVAIGSYTANNAWEDIVVLLVFGALGWLATLWGWPLPPLLLGLVLGRTAERNYFLSYSLFGYGWVTRPIVLILLALTVFGLAWPTISAALARRRARRELSAATEVNVATS